MNDKISVVVPAYNIQDHISGALESLRRQTYVNLEIIVVDDGSTDDTGHVADTYAELDQRIRVIHTENQGVTAARLHGVMMATGKYIGFADGDDYVEPEMYARLMEHICAFQADISHCGYQMVYPDGHADYYHNSGEVVVQTGLRGCADLLDGSFVEPSLVNKLYDHRLFEGLDDWMDKTIRINEDLLMNFYLFRRAEVSVFEDICPYHYVLRHGSAATSGLNAHKLKDPLHVLRLLLNETMEVPEWNRIVKRRYVYQLINSATVDSKELREMVVPFRSDARKTLRKELHGVLADNYCSSKLKFMALWAALWPASYRWVHNIYARVTGIDKKFSVEQ